MCFVNIYWTKNREKLIYSTVMIPPWFWVCKFNSRFFAYRKRTIKALKILKKFELRTKRKKNKVELSSNWHHVYTVHVKACVTMKKYLFYWFQYFDITTFHRALWSQILAKKFHPQLSMKCLYIIIFWAI